MFGVNEDKNPRENIRKNKKKINRHHLSIRIGKIIPWVVVIILIILLVWYYLYKNYYNNYNYIKKDIDQYLVYTKQTTTNNQNLKNEIPEINIDSQDADLVNKTIQTYAASFLKNKDNLMVYDSQLNGQVLSILLKMFDYSSGYSFPDISFHTYNFDLTDQTLMSDEEVLKLFNVTEKTVRQKIQDQFEFFYNDVVAKKYIVPQEKLLVADSLMGQDAVNIAHEFNDRIGITGIILTRVDGGGRAGAALSMKIATGCPIKYMSSGEKLDAFDEFHPERIASKILDMGDIVSFVEKAQEVVDEEEAEKLEKRIQKGEFDLDDFLSQLRNLKKLGGIGNMLSFLPGASKLKEFMQNKGFDDNLLKKQESIVYSMTKLERKKPEILNSSRKLRIAKGSGTSIQEVNSLLKKFKEIKKTIEIVGSMDKNQLKGIMNQLGNIKNSDFNF